MISLFLEPPLDPFTIIVVLLVCRIGAAAVHDRNDLKLLSRTLGWFHGGLTFLLLVNRYQPAEAGDLALILLRSVLAAWLCLGAWQIALPVLAGFYERTIGAMWIRLKQCVRTIVASVRANQRVVAPMPIKEPPRQESEAQLLERARRLEEMRLAEVQKLVDERRREEARLRSELLYDRHARQLAASFPRERFEQFVERYMSEATAPELVDQREQWLKEMMMDSLGTVTIPKFASLSDLATFFSDRRRDIDKLPHAEDLKDIYHKQLNKQEDEALRRLLKP